MKKLLIAPIISLFLFSFLSCTSPGNRIDSIEKRLAAIEMIQKDFEISPELLLAESVGAQSKVFPFQGLTGGCGRCLDGISVSGIQDIDLAIGRGASGSPYGYIYTYDTNDTSVESLPDVIIPDDNITGIGAWNILDRFYSKAFYSTAPDGEHYIDVSNSGAPSSNSDGRLTVRRDRDIALIQDGSINIPINVIRQYTVTTNTNLDAKYLFGTTIYVNSGSTVTLSINNNVEVGMKFRVIALQAAQVRIDPNGTEKIYCYGVDCGAGDYIYSNSSVGAAIELEYKASGQWFAREISAEGDWNCI